MAGSCGCPHFGVCAFRHGDPYWEEGGRGGRGEEEGRRSRVTMDTHTRAAINSLSNCCYCCPNMCTIISLRIPSSSSSSSTFLFAYWSSLFLSLTPISPWVPGVYDHPTNIAGVRLVMGSRSTPGLVLKTENLQRPRVDSSSNNVGRAQFVWEKKIRFKNYVINRRVINRY